MFFLKYPGNGSTHRLSIPLSYVDWRHVTVSMDTAIECESEAARLWYSHLAPTPTVPARRINFFVVTFAFKPADLKFLLLR